MCLAVVVVVVDFRKLQLQAQIKSALENKLLFIYSKVEAPIPYHWQFIGYRDFNRTGAQGRNQSCDDTCLGYEC